VIIISHEKELYMTYNKTKAEIMVHIMIKFVVTVIHTADIKGIIIISQNSW
jgi:dTDP-glucose pyrophosphorylase